MVELDLTSLGERAGANLFGHAATHGDEEKRCVDYEDIVEDLGFGKYQYLVVLICGIANATDAIEILSLSYILPEISDGLPKWTEGALSSAVFAGMLTGAMVCGFMTDRLGRRPVLIGTMLLNAIFTAKFAFAREHNTMVAIRFLTGFGVGGSSTVMFTMPAEIAPAMNRGAAIAGVASFWMIGSISVAATAWAVIPVLGWRTFALICAAPSLCCAILATVVLSESPRFLLVRQRCAEAEVVVKRIYGVNGREPVQHLKLSPLVTSKQGALSEFLELFSARLRTRTFLLAMIWMGICFGWYGLTTWIPTLFKQRGVNLCFNGADRMSCVYQSALFVACANAPGNIISLLLVDRLGRNPLMSTSMVGASLAALAAWMVEDPFSTGILFCIFNGLSVIGWNVLDILSAEMFPTSLRGVAMGSLSSLGRVASVLAQFQFSLAGPEHSLLVCSSALAVAAMATFFLPDLSRTPLKDG